MEEGTRHYRVAEYTKLLYQSAVEMEIEIGESKAKEYNFEDEDGAYNAGLFAHNMPEKNIIPRDMQVTGETLVTLAYILERMSKDLPLGDPIQWVVDRMMERLDEDGDMYMLLKVTVLKLKKVLKSHPEGSEYIAVPKMVVPRRATRPMALAYSDLFRANGKNLIIARPAYNDTKDGAVDITELESLIREKKLIPEMLRYYIYELADMYRLMENRNIEAVLLLAIPGEIMNSTVRTAEYFREAAQRNDIEPSRLGLAVDAKEKKKLARTSQTVVDRMTEAGFTIENLGLDRFKLEDFHFEEEAINKAMMALGLLVYPEIEG